MLKFCTSGSVVLWLVSTNSGSDNYICQKPLYFDHGGTIPVGWGSSSPWALGSVPNNPMLPFEMAGRSEYFLGPMFEESQAVEEFAY